MRYAIVGLLLVAAACSSSDKSGTPTGPTGVVSVRMNASTASIAVGATDTLTATALDVNGNTIAGTATWQTSSASIAAVSTGGVVTGVAPGTATITATISGKSAQTAVTVTAPVLASCAGGATPLSLAVGVVHTLTTAERSTLCLPGGTTGSEYVLVPFKADTVSALVPVSMNATGVIATTGAPTLAAAIAALPRARGTSSPLRNLAMHGAFGAAFEHRLRIRERAQLTPLVTAAPRATLLRGMQHASANRSAILNLPANPAIGTYVALNTNSDSACNDRVNHAARIAAVSKTAIIAVDSLAPAGGFTDADFASFAATFDTLIFPLDTAAYGAPADLDNNGRVLIFFTQTVNQLTPRGSDGYVGGFFFSRDLFPDSTQSSLLQGCPASNQGEMFYVPVVDPQQQYNEFFASKAELQIQLLSTLVHEFQHLINASRRLYVVQTVNWDEEVWLNEGMSHIAEELLYFHESGFAPKQNLSLATVSANQTELDAVNNFQIENLLRLNTYLAAPGPNSPYAENDSLQTRGATYELLRYSMDESPNSNSSYLHALINTQNTGIVNFNTVFAGTFTNIFTAVQQQVLANFFDDSGIAVDPKYSFPSWNYRDVIGNGIDNMTNPLAMNPLIGTTSFTLTGGGAGYARFRVAANGAGTITSASGSGAVPANVIMLLIRTQ
jgi:hypothetical protein